MISSSVRRCLYCRSGGNVKLSRTYSWKNGIPRCLIGDSFRLICCAHLLDYKVLFLIESFDRSDFSKLAVD